MKAVPRHGAGESLVGTLERGVDVGFHPVAVLHPHTVPGALGQKQSYLQAELFRGAWIPQEAVKAGGLDRHRVSVDGLPGMQPFQIIFNPTSAAELSKLPKDLQLQVLGQFRGLPSELMRDEGAFGSLSRQGRTLTRYRLGDYRVYFERHPLGVVVHRILSRNTLKDFLYRSSLPTGEDEQLQGNPKFWELIAAAKSSR